MPATARISTRSARAGITGRCSLRGGLIGRYRHVLALKWYRVERQRLDKWLWHARVVKARTSAAALVEAGHVRINGVREKAPGHAVKAGDVLTVGLDRSVRILRIVGFSARRGDATAARVLYEEVHSSKQ